MTNHACHWMCQNQPTPNITIWGSETDFPRRYGQNEFLRPPLVQEVNSKPSEVHDDQRKVKNRHYRIHSKSAEFSNAKNPDRFAPLWPWLKSPYGHQRQNVKSVHYLKPMTNHTHHFDRQIVTFPNMPADASETHFPRRYGHFELWNPPDLKNRHISAPGRLNWLLRPFLTTRIFWIF